MSIALKEIRSQHSKGTFPHCGPDTYVTVQIVPDDVQPLVCLNERAAERRGIELIYCGEGYHNRQATPRSMLRQAIDKADTIVAEHNSV